MAPVNWANSDEDIEANLQWIADRHKVAGGPYNRCPNTYCSREWHGEPKGTPGEGAVHRSGSFGYYCPGSHKYGVDGRPLE
jgi:hypothetical protein